MDCCSRIKWIIFLSTLTLSAHLFSELETDAFWMAVFWYGELSTTMTHSAAEFGSNCPRNYLSKFLSVHWIAVNISRPIPVAALFKAWVCDRSLGGTTGCNPAGGMDVCLLRMFDHSSLKSPAKCRVYACYLDALTMRRPWPTRGRFAMGGRWNIFPGEYGQSFRVGHWGPLAKVAVFINYSSGLQTYH